MKMFGCCDDCNGELVDAATFFAHRAAANAPTEEVRRQKIRIFLLWLFCSTTTVSALSDEA